MRRRVAQLLIKQFNSSSALQTDTCSMFGRALTVTPHRPLSVVARVAEMNRSDMPAVKLTRSTDIRQAITLACETLNRDVDEELIARLEDNWYTTANDILNVMSDDELDDLKVPRKLKSHLATLLVQSESDNSVPTTASVADYSSLPKLSSTGDLLPTESQSITTEQEEEWESLPIEQRVCPDLQRFGFEVKNRPNVVKRGRPSRYAISNAEINSTLEKQHVAFIKFLTERFWGQQVDPISLVTADKYWDHCRGALGWLHRYRNVPLEDLKLELLVPSSKRSGAQVCFDYLQWLRSEREVSIPTESLVLRSIMSVAKFIYHDESDITVTTGDKPYCDLEIVKELRAMVNSNRKAIKVAGRVADEGLKWIDWPDYLKLCHELKKECAGLKADGTVRPPRDIAWSLQRYLIFAILSCVPDRQRTLRELQVDKTLLKDGERWIIKHTAADYKTGKSYGERPPLVLAPRLYNELEAYINEYRAYLEPEHDFLFTQKNKEPYTDKQLYKMFWTTSYRITGRRVNPHLIRDSIVTYLRGGSASEKELEALALYMGHSIEMQRGTYDRRTQAQKVGPAVDLLETLNNKAMQLQ